MVGRGATMKVVLLAPGFDGTDVGEAYVGFKWAEALSARVDLTVLALQRAGRTPLAAQLPNARVVTFPEPPILLRAERLNAMLKPAWPLLFRHARRFLRAERAAGRGFDIAHQIMPLPARYPSPFQGQGMPYVLGPVGGSLPTPPGFQGEVGGGSWYTRLRRLDALRLARDPWLRRSFSQADLVLGVAPYVADVLSAVPLRRFELELELGVDPVDPAPLPPRPTRPGPIRLLHVGRGVRTKGLLEVVRAMPLLSDLDVHLTSAGDGSATQDARAEVDRLRLGPRVTFEGRVPRDRVDTLYDEADIFAFPSFREPTGGVLYEAMLAGLPIVTADYGGPQHIVSEAVGLRVPVTDPETMPADVADALRRLIAAPDLRARMGSAARAQVLETGTWPRKADRLVALYREVLETAGPRR